MSATVSAKPPAAPLEKLGKELLESYLGDERARRIAQPSQAALGKTLPPLDDRVGTGTASPSHFLDSLAIQTTQDDLSSLNHLFRFGSTPGQPFQFQPVFQSTTNCGRMSCHARNIQYIAYLCK